MKRLGLGVLRSRQDLLWTAVEQHLQVMELHTFERLQSGSQEK
jgi:hypothetical protein